MMKTRIIIILAVCIVTWISSSAWAELYWDVNGAAGGGSNSTTAPGTWGVDNFWSTSSAGSLASGAWVPGETAVFSAGTNVTGAYSVTLDSTQSAAGVLFQEGVVDITGGTELTLVANTSDFNDDGVVDAGDFVIWRKSNGTVAPGAGTQATGDANGDTNVDTADYGVWRLNFGKLSGAIDVSSASSTVSSVIGGTTRLKKTGAGTLNLTSSNTYSGGTRISAGKLAINNFSAMGSFPGASTPNRVEILNGATLSSSGTGFEFLVGNNLTGVTFGAGAGTIEITDPAAQLAIQATVSGSEKWTKSGPGELQLLNGANPFTAGFKVTGGVLVHSAFEARADTGGTLRGSGASPSSAVSDYVVLDGGTIRYNNTGLGSTFLSSNKGITLTANGGGLMLKNPVDGSGNEIPTANTSISTYFGKVSAAPGAILYKRGKGEIRGDRAALTDPDLTWDQTKLVVEEGLFRVGHFGEETIFGKVPTTYLADAIRLDGRGTTRSTGGAAIGLTSAASGAAGNIHNAVTTTPATRGIYVEANGGTIVTSLGTGSWVFDSIISGPGGININGNGFVFTGAGDFATATSTVVFKGANTYAGFTQVNAGKLVVDGASAKLGGGDVIVDGISTGIDGGTNNASGRLQILSGVANAIANTATLSLTGGGVAATPDFGYVDLGTGINETINKLMLTISGTPTPVGPGVFGSTASGAANPGLAGLGVNPDEYFAGAGTLTVLSAGSGSSLDNTSVPEPTSAMLLAAGLAGLAVRRRQR